MDRGKDKENQGFSDIHFDQFGQFIFIVAFLMLDILLRGG